MIPVDREPEEFLAAHDPRWVRELSDVLTELLDRDRTSWHRIR